MTCTKCKKSIPDDSNICCYCGKKFTRTVPIRRRANGMGTAYKRGRTFTSSYTYGWQVKEDEKGKRLIPKKLTKDGFDTRVKALSYCAVLKEKADELLSDVSNEFAVVQERKTIQHYWDLYESTKYKKLSDTKRTAYRIAHGKMESINHRTVEEVSIKDLQDLVDEKAPTYYPAKDMKTVITKIWELAIVDEETTINKGKHISLPELLEKDPEPFTEDELKSMWVRFAVGDIPVGYPLLMIYSGMMPGELLACEKAMVDLSAQTIIGCGKKTKKRRTTPIVLADFVVPVVQALMEFSKGKKLVTMNKDKFYVEYYDTLERCGCRRLEPYSCRHTTATALAIGGAVVPSVIQEVMRHASFRSTQRYIHPDVSDSLKAVNKLKIHEATDNIPTTKA